MVSRRAGTTPIDFEIDEAKGIVWTTAHGVLTGAELEEFGQRLFTAPRRPSPYRGLCDLRDVTRFEGSTDGIRGLARLAVAEGSEGRPPGGRLALVTGSTVIFGLTRMFQTLSESPDFEIGVFEADLDAALAWLAQPSPTDD